VAQLRAVIAQNLADQEPAVALLRLAATTQQRDAVLSSALQDPTNRGNESGLLSHLRVQRVPVSIEVLLALWTSAKRET